MKDVIEDTGRIVPAIEVASDHDLLGIRIAPRHFRDNVAARLLPEKLRSH